MENAEELFQRNLDFFKRVQPVLYQRLEAYEPLGTLEYDEDGDPDIVFEGMKLYKHGAQKYADLQVQKFWREPERVAARPISSSNVDDDAQKVLYELLKFADDNAIEFSSNRIYHQAYHLFVMGVGLGKHLKPLLEGIRPRNCVLIEPNFEFIYQSMFCCDWEGTFEDHIEDGGFLHILVDNEFEVVISSLRNLFRKCGPGNFDGLTIFRHYENPLTGRLVKYFLEEGDMFFTGLGYFEDELNMVANTYINLKTGQERVFLADAKSKDFPVFIVGSGPSLDNAIDQIRENQHKAVVISCGTALAPLLRGGVVPDFQIELERSEWQVKMPELTSKDSDVSKICLISSSTVVEGLKEIYQERVYYFRHMLSSFPVFSDDVHNCLRNPSPTVGNAGCSFAQDVGFREFYLCGMDLGFRDDTAHHSKSALYYDLYGEENKSGWDRVVPGNFGGEIKSTYVLQWSRDMIEQSIIDMFQGYQYYNCSDGTLIRGTVPLLPELISLPEPAEPKEQFVRRLIESFPLYTKEKFQERWEQAHIIEDVQDLCQTMVDIIEENPDLLTKKYASEIIKKLDALEYRDVAQMILRGTVYQFITITEYYLDRVIDGDKRQALVQLTKDVLIREIRALSDVAVVELTHLAEQGVLKDRAG